MKSRKRHTEAIDWKQIRRRLERVLKGAEETVRMSPERARAVLEERARILARVPAEAVHAEVIEVVIFALAGEQYAVETRFVRGVVRLTDYTSLPGAPPFLAGVLNLRGDILAVIDLRVFFGVAVKGLTDLARVLVLGLERDEFGVLADATLEVRKLRSDEVLAPPDSVSGIGRQYLRGVTREALILLDGAVLLQDSRLFIDEDEAQ